MMKLWPLLFACTALAQPDPLFSHADVPWFNDPSYVRDTGGQWYLQNTGAPWTLWHNGIVQQTESGGTYDIKWSEQDSSGVTVGIVNSGAAQHEDLALFLEPVVPGDGHGTGMAGVVGATRNNGIGMAGVCNSPLLVAGGGWRTEQIAAGIAHCATNGVRVILLAWGTSVYDDALSNACQLTAQSNIVLVCATANITADLWLNPDWPLWLNFPNMIAVSAANQFGGYYIGCTGTNVLFAPGKAIVRTKGTNEYCYANGTSEAAAVAAGVCAIVCARYPGQDAEAIIQAVRGDGLLDMQVALTSPVPVMVAGPEVRVLGLSKWRYLVQHSPDMVAWQDYGVVMGGESLPAVEGFYRCKVL